jgi:hypothetical protein
MTLYSIALFLHIAGAVLLFATLTVEGVSMLQGNSVVAINRVIGPISLVLVLFPGLYMVATTWGWKAWVLVGIGAWVVIAVLGAVNGIRSVRSGGAVGSVASWWTRIGLAAGVTFLMTTKPDLVGSITAVLLGAAVGWAVSAVTRRTRATA